MINELCDEDNILPMSKRDIEIKKFEPLKLGVARDILKEEVCLEETYNKEAARRKKEKEKELRSKNEKKNLRVFGYKYPKVLKFLA